MVALVDNAAVKCCRGSALWLGISMSERSYIVHVFKIPSARMEPAIGDNRSQTSSSCNFGTTPIRDVVGKPILKWRAAYGDASPM
ncbi:MAG TPA: hypothetical protein VKA31_03530 [Mariprofundaceae bacterium]|nr:hypothetical protein [Mariprofundaceae bacterium]